MEIVDLVKIFLPDELSKVVGIVGVSDKNILIAKYVSKYNKPIRDKTKKDLEKYTNMEVCMLPPQAFDVTTYNDVVSYVDRSNGDSTYYMSKFISTDKFTPCKIIVEIVQEMEQVSKHIASDKYLILHDFGHDELNEYNEEVYDIITGKFICKIERFYTDFIEKDILYTFRHYGEVRTYDISKKEMKIFPLAEPIRQKDITLVEFNRGLNIFAFVLKNATTKIFHKSGKLLYTLDGTFYFTQLMFLCNGVPTVMMKSSDDYYTKFMVNEMFLIKTDYDKEPHMPWSHIQQVRNILTERTYKSVIDNGSYAYYKTEGILITKINSEKLYEKFIEREIQELLRLR